jgi:predicted ribosomally synthesized peptide with SipW-like signal peptide
MKMNKKAAALGGLAAVAVVGGTWAYFNQTAAITNPAMAVPSWRASTRPRVITGSQALQ